MSDIADVASCLKKIKTKNLGQNKNNLINSLSKDYGYSKESANKIIEKAVKENMVRIVCLTGRTLTELLRTGRTQLLYQKRNRMTRS